MSDLSPARRAVHDTLWLSLGTGLSGLAAYAFIVIGTRSLGAEGFAPVSVLWTLWAMSAAVLTFPIQHWVIRSIESGEGEGTVRAALPSLALVAVALSVIMGAGVWPGRDALFGTDAATFPILTAVIPIGSVAMGLTRGGLASRRRFVATAAAIAGENAIRVVVAAALAIAGAGAEAFGIGLIAGFGIGFAWPSGLAFARPGHAHSRLSPLAFVGGIAGGSLIGQIVLTSGPLALVILGGAPATVTALFSALALFRAPYMLATGVAVRVTGFLTHLVVQHRDEEVRRLYWATVIATVLVVPAAGAFGLYFGPPLLRVVFGPEVELSGTAMAAVAAGSSVAVIALFAMLALVATARVALATGAWVAAALVGVAWAIFGAGSPLSRVTVAFLIAELSAMGLMMLGTAALGRRVRSAGSLAP